MIGRKNGAKFKLLNHPPPKKGDMLQLAARESPLRRQRFLSYKHCSVVCTVLNT